MITNGLGSLKPWEQDISRTWRDSSWKVRGPNKQEKKNANYNDGFHNINSGHSPKSTHANNC